MNIRMLVVLILVIGVSLFSYSITLLYYKNQKAADDLLNNSMNINKDEYYKKEAENRTNKLTYEDLGAGISIAAASILIFLFVTKVKTISDLKKVRSFNKVTIFITANLVWLMLIPGTFWYYSYRGGRGDYPPFADSIGIPIFGQTIAYLIILIPLNLFIILTTIRSNLPTRIFVKARYYYSATVLWEIFFGFWLLINLICFVAFVADGDHFSIVINLFFTYILLSLRAGQISEMDDGEEIEYHAE